MKECHQQYEKLLSKNKPPTPVQKQSVLLVSKDCSNFISYMARWHVYKFVSEELTY